MSTHANYWLDQEDLHLKDSNKEAILLIHPKPITDAMDAGEIDAYAKIAQQVGFQPPRVAIAMFKSFLASNDMPVFNLGEVTQYMDAKAQAAKQDWTWLPLRSKDFLKSYPFPKAPYSSQPYPFVVPAHALEKVVLIEREFGPRVYFYVADYNVPNPDPFLLAAIPSPRDRGTEGLFVIDFWDEPGFGVESMVK